MFPEITVIELADKLKSEEKFILLDVRELTELNYAKIEDSRDIKMSSTCAGGSTNTRAKWILR